MAKKKARVDFYILGWGALFFLYLGKALVGKIASAAMLQQLLLLVVPAISFIGVQE
jgi:hypothetical protein